MESAQLLVFFIASVAVIMTPGQDLLLVMSRGMAQGSKAGIVTAAGVSLGLLGHTCITTLGLGALFLTSEIFFTLVKYLGAAYLIYLGVHLLKSKREAFELSQIKSVKYSKLFMMGAFSNISNPKITIFYLAFLPQFITNQNTHPTLTLFSLGVSFAVLTFVIKAPIGYFAGISSLWLQARPKVINWIDRVSGSVLIALGIRLALEERSF